MAIYAVFFFPFRIFRMTLGIRQIPSAIISSILSCFIICFTANVDLEATSEAARRGFRSRFRGLVGLPPRDFRPARTTHYQDPNFDAHHPPVEVPLLQVPLMFN